MQAGKKGNRAKCETEIIPDDSVEGPRKESDEPNAKRAKFGRADGKGKQENTPAVVAIAAKDEEAPHRKKLTTHVGRFQKVARNKHVKGYSATDLAAILGANGDEQVIISLSIKSKSVLCLQSLWMLK